MPRHTLTLLLAAVALAAPTAATAAALAAVDLAAADAVTATSKQPPPPPPFFFGTATAAYQVEGGVHAGGRGPSIWDAFSHTPGKTARGDTGDVADDFFYRFPADLTMAGALGASAFRLSLSWTRLFPGGDATQAPSAAGLDFYNRVLDACEAAGLEPYVTLFHWDLPLALQEEYGGWLSPRIVPDFAAYARAAFTAFGHRVTHWTTLNEPWSFCMQGYGNGQHAPGIVNQTWPCVRHALLAHAAAAAAFRPLVPGGRLSLNLNANWAAPWDAGDADDVAAAQRALDFDLGAFADPLHTGAWPASVAARAPPGLVPFSPAEAAALTAAKPDYFALNYYTAAWIKAKKGAQGGQGQGTVDFVRIQDGTGLPGSGGRGPIGPRAESAWLYAAPWGLRHMLRYVHATYAPAAIVITENGADAPGEDDAPWPASLNDTFRVDYFAGHVAAAEDAVRRDGVPLQGYFAWSLLDNFEWADGYAKRFGIVHVDYATQARSIKASGAWLARRFSGAPRAGGAGGTRAVADV